MKQNKGRTTGFLAGFFITILIAALIVAMPITLSRMENTISANGFTLLNIKENSKNKIEVVALNREFTLNISEIALIMEELSTYDIIIPSEIRAFYAAVKISLNAVEDKLYSLFYG